MDVFSVIALFGGLSLFLFGMKVMSNSLEKMAGGKLERLLKEMTKNPFISMFLGAVITIAVQSSSATTVMLVGLVNSGIMQFSQTINVIFGANIGTTLTSWILSLSGITSDNLFLQLLKPENFSPVFMFIGVLVAMISRNDKRKSIGNVSVGFGLLMYGMVLMKNAVSPLSEMPGFSDLLVKFTNPVLGVLVGLVFTSIIQSSAASIGILQALSLTGGITYWMAIPIVMGQNIGTCATSLISSIGVNKNAKRVAVVHIMIKIVGTIICLSVFCLANVIFKWDFVNKAVSPVSVALIHTVFNILITIILMPCSKLLIKLTNLIVHDNKEKIIADVPFLDERLLRSPSIAVTECLNLTKKMSYTSKGLLFDSIHLIDNFNDKISNNILKKEEIIDEYEDKLGTYLVKLSATELSEEDSQKISMMLHSIGDFERLGDHGVNLVKVANEMNEKNITFTQDASAELQVLNAAISEILDLTCDAFEKNNFELAARVEPLEQVIDGLIENIRLRHIQRLQNGSCTIEIGFVLSDLLINYERISDHCSNVAVAVIEIHNNTFDTHKYLNGVKYGNSEFNSIFDEYSLKYFI